MTRTWYYTQRQWDRVVGWDKVPTEYNKPKSDEEEMSEHENDITLESEEDEQEDKSVDENTDD